MQQDVCCKRYMQQDLCGKKNATRPLLQKYICNTNLVANIFATRLVLHSALCNMSLVALLLNLFLKQSLCFRNKTFAIQNKLGCCPFATNVVLRSFPLQEKACCRNNKKTTISGCSHVVAETRLAAAVLLATTAQEGSDGGHGFKSSVRLGKKEGCGRRKMRGRNGDCGGRP